MSSNDKNDNNIYPHTNILEPGENDILYGRGGGNNVHPGNIKFRKLVAAHKLRYLAASKSEKPTVSRDVVLAWRAMDPPGRFLARKRRDNGDGNDCNSSSANSTHDERYYYYDVGDKKAREKTSQCLRERNGAANEALTALVKTVTEHTGEACPADYQTLVNKAQHVAKSRQQRNSNPCFDFQFTANTGPRCSFAVDDEREDNFVARNGRGPSPISSVTSATSSLTSRTSSRKRKTVPASTSGYPDFHETAASHPDFCGVTNEELSRFKRMVKESMFHHNENSLSSFASSASNSNRHDSNIIESCWTPQKVDPSPNVVGAKPDMWFSSSEIPSLQHEAFTIPSPSTSLSSFASGYCGTASSMVSSYRRGNFNSAMPSSSHRITEKDTDMAAIDGFCQECSVSYPPAPPEFKQFYY